MATFLIRDRQGRFIRKKIKTDKQVRSRSAVVNDVIIDHNYVTDGERSDVCRIPSVKPHVNKESWRVGRRIVEWDVLLSNLKFCKECLLGPVPLTFDSVIGEMKKGLGGFLYVRCQNGECGHVNCVPYGKTHRMSQGKGMPCFAINTKLGTGRGRYILLVFDCMLVVGIYFCTDIPSALQTQIETPPSDNCTAEGAANRSCCSDCLGLGAAQYNLLYTVYSWTSSLMILPVGFAIDRMGNRVSAVVFTGLATSGSFLFAISSLPSIRNTSFMFPLMMIGRLLIGAGTGSSRIVRDRVIASWFPDRLAMAFGIAVSTMGLGSVLTFLLTSNIANWIGLGPTLFVGAGVCSTCFISAICLCYIDWYGTKYHSGTKVTIKATSGTKLSTIRKFPKSFWLISVMIATYYSFQLPFTANGSKFIQEKFGYSKTHSSYINGVIYDVSVLISPFVGIVLDKVGYRGWLAFIGALMTVPMGLVLLFTELPPLPVYIWLGVTFTITVVALWSSIPYVVPRSAIGTANGIVSCMLDLTVGSTTLIIGQTVSHSESSDDDTMSTTWNFVFLLIFGLSAISAVCGLLLNTICKGKGNKVNGKSGLKRTYSVGSVHCPPPHAELAEADKEVPRDDYTIFKDIVIENKSSPMWRKYSSKKKTKYDQEINDSEISTKSNYMYANIENNIDIIISIGDFLSVINDKEKKKEIDASKGNNESIPGEVDNMVKVATEKSTHARG